MVRKETMLVAFTCLLVVASIAVSANATAAPRLLATEQVYYPQGCRCCLFVGKVPNIRCARTCCSSPKGENCCVAT
ncbi:hypothetical protein POPTR_006G002301v4 [Populus trichocarpa]|uniref:Uncharacterized protein n=2 Tax=Populus TaxID=3689 RepID=A0A3N7F6E6_POPTR|nr:hypothetical protein POTOM_022283 [Populus tomentosa]KAI5583251.1 hypothetical protein BDE02_06G002000 [Populus trichocarpa]RQO91095.1 hypothetical protein POPTR_006G002301v4 [Populus trichocarpa]